MSKKKRNVRLIAEVPEGKNQFDIYIERSGERNYLMSHRNNNRLYGLLKDGTSLEALRRNAAKAVSNVTAHGCRSARKMKTRRNRARKLENSIEHLIIVANEYLNELDYSA